MLSVSTWKPRPSYGRQFVRRTAADQLWLARRLSARSFHSGWQCRKPSIRQSRRSSGSLAPTRTPGPGAGSISACSRTWRRSPVSTTAPDPTVATPTRHWLHPTSRRAMDRAGAWSSTGAPVRSAVSTRAGKARTRLRAGTKTASTPGGTVCTPRCPALAMPHQRPERSRGGSSHETARRRGGLLDSGNRRSAARHLVGPVCVWLRVRRQLAPRPNCPPGRCWHRVGRMVVPTRHGRGPARSRSDRREPRGDPGCRPPGRDSRDPDADGGHAAWPYRRLAWLRRPDDSSARDLSKKCFGLGRRRHPELSLKQVPALVVSADGLGPIPTGG